MQPLMIGSKGTVLALDRTTGREIWRTPLKGGDFVNVTLTGDQVLATTRGEIFCLDKAGTILWQNPLKGLGQGLVTIATEASSAQAAVCAEKQRQDAQVAAGAAAAGATDATATPAGFLRFLRLPISDRRELLRADGQRACPSLA